MTKYGNYRTLGGTHDINDFERITKWLCFLGDGKNSLESVSYVSKYKLNDVRKVFKDLLRAGVLVENRG